MFSNIQKNNYKLEYNLIMYYIYVSAYHVNIILL